MSHYLTLVILILITTLNWTSVEILVTMKTMKETEVSLLLDNMSKSFMMTVMNITTMIILYSTSYMKNEVMKKRFLYLMLIFVASMLILLTSPNIYSLMLGWDGLGLSSFCLVIFYQNYSSLGSGIITIMTNRIGDCMMITAVCFAMSTTTMKSQSMKKIQAVLIMTAAFTSSAQTPFSAWLPAAMAAPTPVSSLVHSSTLVTAGVYMMSRFNALMDKKFIKEVLLTSSMATSVMAGLTAWKETDAKKIVAMSTLSQLGIMTFALSLKMWNLCLFHMTTHAMFKALLFMTTGYNMETNQGAQNKNMMNMNSSKMETMMNTSIMALMGAPFLSGFYSKDLIIESCVTKESNLFIAVMFTAACVLTTTYSVTLVSAMKNKKTDLFAVKLSTMNKGMEKPTAWMYLMALLVGAAMSEMLSTQTSKTNLTTKKLGLMFILWGMAAKKLSNKKMSLSTMKMIMLNNITKDLITPFNEKFKKLNKMDLVFMNKSTTLFMWEEVMNNSMMSTNMTKSTIMSAIILMYIAMIIIM